LKVKLRPESWAIKLGKGGGGCGGEGKGEGEGKPSGGLCHRISTLAINNILSFADCAMFAALTRLLNQAI